MVCKFTAMTLATFVVAGMEHDDTKFESQLQDGRPQTHPHVMAPEWDQRLRPHDDVAIARNQLDRGTTRRARFCYFQIYPR
jgi:hypothetical protein